MKIHKKYHYPNRIQFGTESKKAVLDVFNYYKKIGRDFGVGGIFKQTYCQSFSKYINCDQQGFTEAVSSGTEALFVSVRALQLPKNSEVLVSPITDPGMINAVILNDLKPKLFDFSKDFSTIDINELNSRISHKTKAILVNHLSGKPIANIDRIYQWAKKNKLYLIEDASQCHGGFLLINGKPKKIGNFSDIACFSTMFSKNHSSGGAGGLIYTKSKKLFNRISVEVDKGKNRQLRNFNEKDPNTFLQPAHNLPLNEISCAIGITTLKKLDETNKKRNEFLKKLHNLMKNKNLKTELLTIGEGMAPYFAIFTIDSSFKKKTFTDLLVKKGLPLNADYRYLVSSWQWVKPYLADDYQTLNAQAFLKQSFNLLFNENFKKNEAIEIAKQISLVENNLRSN